MTRLTSHAQFLVRDVMLYYIVLEYSIYSIWIVLTIKSVHHRWLERQPLKLTAEFPSGITSSGDIQFLGNHSCVHSVAAVPTICGCRSDRETVELDDDFSVLTSVTLMLIAEPEQTAPPVAEPAAVPAVGSYRSWHYIGTLRFWSCCVLCRAGELSCERLHAWGLHFASGRETKKMAEWLKCQLQHSVCQNATAGSYKLYSKSCLSATHLLVAHICFITHRLYRSSDLE